MASLIQPVILSGGAGTRLWPVSREQRPKQFLTLMSDKSILQETALRVGAPARFGGPMLVASEDHRFLVAEQMRQIGVKPVQIVLEPLARSTAPAIAAAALLAAETDPETVLLVLPSDHMIRDLVAFHAAIDKAAAAARIGKLVTFGIAPDGPRTGYGYIRMGDSVEGLPGVYAIAQFVEKPPEAKAKAMLVEGGWSWNSGMFAFTAARLIEEMARYRPDILAAARAAVATAQQDLGFLRLGREAFLASPSEPLDRAVMEHTDRAAVIPAGFGWSDVGSWGALWEVTEKDAAGNASRGDVRMQDTRNSLVFSDRRLVATLGVDHLIIVETNDAVLVADRSRSQEVRDIVEGMQGTERTEHLSHTRVYRPWGYFENLDSGPGFLVKRIMVKPGAALSLQLHHHRAEHWVVVSGAARVTRGEEITLLVRNQSIYIALGEIHRLENPSTDEPLHLIEVQSGDKISEDDIVRFEDRYKR